MMAYYRLTHNPITVLDEDLYHARIVRFLTDSSLCQVCRQAIWWRGAFPHTLVVEERDMWPDIFNTGGYGFGIVISERARMRLERALLINPVRVQEVKVVEYCQGDRIYIDFPVRYFLYHPEGVVHLHLLPEASLRDVKRCVCGRVSEIWDIAKSRQYAIDWTTHTGQPIVSQVTLIEGVPLYPEDGYIVNDNWRQVWEDNALTGAEFALRS